MYRRSLWFAFLFVCIITNLSIEVAAQVGTVDAIQKISSTAGNFGGTLYTSSQFGKGIDGIGDLNGDGVEDLVIGAQENDEVNSNRGAAWVLLMNADGSVLSEHKISAFAGGFGGTINTGDLFGFAAAGLGDVDNNGVNDIAISASRNDDGGTDRGAVWIILLDTTEVNGVVTAVSVKSEHKISDTAGGFTGVLDNFDNFGHGGLEALGDLDQNGVSDLAVGAYRDDDGGTDRGAVWILYLSYDSGTDVVQVQSHKKISDLHGNFSSSPHCNPDSTISDPLANDDRFGTGIALLGDVNQDGNVDIAVGTPNDEDATGADFAGSVWVLMLDANQDVQCRVKIAENRGGFGGNLEFDEQFALAMDAGGDLDGDGVPDLVSTAPLDRDGSGLQHGSAWVLFLNSDGTVKSEQKISEMVGGGPADLSDDAFGMAAAFVDIDGIGTPELVIGATRDDDGGTNHGAAYVLFLEGAEEAPVVDSIAVTELEPVPVSTTVSFSADFSDVNSGDTHSAHWDWGDGTSCDTISPTPGDVCTLTQGAGSGTVDGAHTYVDPGVYTVTLTVIDNAGLSGEAIYEFVVVYDPEGGFVTGGGWIDSPPGAYIADTTIVGKANFGFQSQYQNGVNVPTGNTQFKLKVADLDFNSTVYDWLVIASSKAMFKGDGTINDSGNYGFQITAIDEALAPSKDEDLFRIKIWDKDNNNALVYDNQVGEMDPNADPTTVLGGGNIKIHQSGGNPNEAGSDRAILSSTALPTEFALHENYPNPFNPHTVIRVDIPEQSDVQLRVFDILGREVAVLVNGSITAGVHEIRFDGGQLPSGVYIYHFETTAGSFARRMLLVK